MINFEKARKVIVEYYENKYYYNQIDEELIKDPTFAIELMKFDSKIRNGFVDFLSWNEQFMLYEFCDDALQFYIKDAKMKEAIAAAVDQRLQQKRINKKHPNLDTPPTNEVEFLSGIRNFIPPHSTPVDNVDGPEQESITATTSDQPKSYAVPIITTADISPAGSSCEGVLPTIPEGSPLVDFKSVPIPEIRNSVTGLLSGDDAGGSYLYHLHSATGLQHFFSERQQQSQFIPVSTSPAPDLQISDGEDDPLVKEFREIMEKHQRQQQQKAALSPEPPSPIIRRKKPQKKQIVRYRYIIYAEEDMQEAETHIAYDFFPIISNDTILFQDVNDLIHSAIPIPNLDEIIVRRSKQQQEFLSRLCDKYIILPSSSLQRQQVQSSGTSATSGTGGKKRKTRQEQENSQLQTPKESCMTLMVPIQQSTPILSGSLSSPQMEIMMFDDLLQINSAECQCRPLDVIKEAAADITVVEAQLGINYTNAVVQQRQQQLGAVIETAVADELILQQQSQPQSQNILEVLEDILMREELQQKIAEPRTNSNTTSIQNIVPAVPEIENLSMEKLPGELQNHVPTPFATPSEANIISNIHDVGSPPKFHPTAVAAINTAVAIRVSEDINDDPNMVELIRSMNFPHNISPDDRIKRRQRKTRRRLILDNDNEWKPSKKQKKNHRPQPLPPPADGSEEKQRQQQLSGERIIQDSNEIHVSPRVLALLSSQPQPQGIVNPTNHYHQQQNGIQSSITPPMEMQMVEVLPAPPNPKDFEEIYDRSPITPPIQTEMLKVFTPPSLINFEEIYQQWRTLSLNDLKDLSDYLQFRRYDVRKLKNQPLYEQLILVERLLIEKEIVTAKDILPTNIKWNQAIQRIKLILEMKKQSIISINADGGTNISHIRLNHGLDTTYSDE